MLGNVTPRTTRKSMRQSEGGEGSFGTAIKPEVEVPVPDAEIDGGGEADDVAAKEKIYDYKPTPFLNDYVNDYLQSTDILDDEARNVSRLLETHAKQETLVTKLESVFEKFLTLDERKASGDNLNKEEMESAMAERSKTLNEMTELLVAAHNVGDDGAAIVGYLKNICVDKAESLDESHNKCVPAGEATPKSVKRKPKTSVNPRRKRLLDIGFQKKLKPGYSDNLMATGSQASDSAASPSSSFKNMFELDFADDSGYRACKFRDPPNYGKMCSKVPVKHRKRKRNSEGDGTEDDDKSKPRGKGSDTSSGHGQPTTPVKAKASRSRSNTSIAKSGSKSRQSSVCDSDDTESSKAEPDQDDEVPDEESYCFCERGYFGKMIECENETCPIKWFHFGCVGLRKTPKIWYCPKCRGATPSVKKS